MEKRREAMLGMPDLIREWKLVSLMCLQPGLADLELTTDFNKQTPKAKWKKYPK